MCAILCGSTHFDTSTHSYSIFTVPCARVCLVYFSCVIWCWWRSVIQTASKAINSVCFLLKIGSDFNKMKLQNEKQCANKQKCPHTHSFIHIATCIPHFIHPSRMISLLYTIHGYNKCFRVRTTISSNERLNVGWQKLDARMFCFTVDRFVCLSACLPVGWLF